MGSLTRFVFRNVVCLKFSVLNFTQFRNYRRYFRPFLQEIRNRQKIIGHDQMIPNHRNTYLEWNYDTELYAFKKRLGEDFEDSLLRRALTEPSYMQNLQEDKKKVGISESAEDSTDLLDNSSLVPAGEQILDEIVVCYLRNILPRFPEEGIQSVKSHLLSENMLAHVASHIGLTELILSQEHPVENATLCRVFKALITALHDSNGFDRTALFIRDFIITLLAEADVNDFWDIENPVNILEIICRNEGIRQLEPRLVGSCAVNTLLPLYRVGYYVDKKLIGLGPGESVQMAKEMAANDALRRLFRTAEHQLSIDFDTIIDTSGMDVPNVSVNEWCEKAVQRRLKMNA